MDFDWKFYVSVYDDLRNDNINTEEKALQHYNKYGRSEGRVINGKNLPKNFDWLTYITFNQDLISNGINTKEKAIVHYLRYGKEEKRIYNVEDYIKINRKFDYGQDYLPNFEEALKAEVLSMIQISRHYLGR